MKNLGIEYNFKLFFSCFLTVAVIENVPAQSLSSSTQKIAKAFCNFDFALDLQKFLDGSLPYPTL